MPSMTYAYKQWSIVCQELCWHPASVINKTGRPDNIFQHYKEKQFSFVLCTSYTMPNL